MCQVFTAFSLSKTGFFLQWGISDLQQLSNALQTGWNFSAEAKWLHKKETIQRSSKVSELTADFVRPSGDDDINSISEEAA